jgi:type I restriction enzyme M protein
VSAETDDCDQSETDAKRGAKAVKERSSIKTGNFFIERGHSYLKPGTGRAAIVLPDGWHDNVVVAIHRHWRIKNAHKRAKQAKLNDQTAAPAK